MTFERIVEMPAERRIVLKLPPELPLGKVKITVTTLPDYGHLETDRETETPKIRSPISRYFGILSPETYGDGVVYQRKLRNEWNE